MLVKNYFGHLYPYFSDSMFDSLDFSIWEIQNVQNSTKVYTFGWYMLVVLEQETEKLRNRKLRKLEQERLSGKTGNWDFIATLIDDKYPFRSELA